jgi:hypothetical protein
MSTFFDSASIFLQDADRRQFMDNNRVLVRDCEGELFEMKVVSAAGSLVYVTACGADDGLDSIGVPAEDVFEFTVNPETKMRQWVQSN